MLSLPKHLYRTTALGGVVEMLRGAQHDVPFLEDARFFHA